MSATRSTWYRGKTREIDRLRYDNSKFIIALEREAELFQSRIPHHVSRGRSDDIQIRTALAKRNQNILPFNAPKRSKTAGLNGSPVELFIAALSAELLFPLTEKSWESETFPKEGVAKEDRPKNGIHLE